MALAIFDSHAHLNDEKFRHELDDVLDRANEAGVKLVMVPGYHLESSRRAVEIAGPRMNVFAAAGISPHESGTANRKTLIGIHFLVQDPACLAVGEIGLDYYYDNLPREIQRVVFREQLALAREINKPIIIHVRDAAEDLFAILREDGLPEAGGVLHCFTGTPEEAAAGLELGLYVSFSGILVFAKGDQLTRSAASIPEDRLLVETDSPYLAPPPWRGQRNEPAFITATIKRLAEIRGTSEEAIAAATYRNACRLYRLDPVLID